MLTRLPSGQWQPRTFLRTMRSRAAVTAMALAVLTCGGGWWYLNSPGPKLAAGAPTDAPRAQQAAQQRPPVALAKKQALPGAKTAQVKPLPTTGSKAGGAAKPATAPSLEANGTATTDARAAAVNPASSKPALSQPLGSTYTDEINGFSLRLPAGWSLRTFAGDPWILDCGDARHGGMISVGFSPLPSDITADQLLPDTIAKRIKRRANTTLQGQGRTTFDGKKALWSKSTGPLASPDGAPRVTRVQYVVPLRDGRVLELRAAAPPEQFDQLASTMGRSLATFKVLPRDGGLDLPPAPGPAKR
ncbi:MAG TPA: hypothetical protein VER17_18440 [Tepidisphaeraceae bacterium]|nr:hypothetical protein [Tepidisphaeraceae bacterium]